MNTLLIGGTSGWCARLVPVLEQQGTVVVTGRSGSFNLNEGTWVGNLYDRLKAAIGGPNNLDSVVLAAYDRRQEIINVQLNAFLSLYSLFKGTNVKLCVIGDMAHHFNHTDSLYNSNKRALYNAVLSKARDPERKCALLLYEPWEVSIEDQVVERLYLHLKDIGEGEFMCLTHRR